MLPNDPDGLSTQARSLDNAREVVADAVLTARFDIVKSQPAE